MNAPDYLVESVPNEVHPARDGRAAAQNPWLAPVFPLLLSAGAGGLCYWAAGAATLGLFLGGLFLAVLLAGPIIAAERTWLGRALAAAGVVHGIAGVWLYAAIQSELDLGLWAACYLTLDAVVFAAGGVAVMLRRLGFGGIGAGAIVTVLGIAWMLWPVWLSPALRGTRGERAVAWLVPEHPIFAANGVLRTALGYWAEQGIAYHYTSLSDDVAYAVPDSVLACVLIHGVVGMAGIGVGLVPRGRRGRNSKSEARSTKQI
jgi:hypothetical protein